jgi:hypothetical protein
MLTNNIMLVLATLGLFQALFLCVYLFALKKGNRMSNIFLALLLLGLTIRVGKSVIGYYIPLESWQRNIGISGIFIAGPCLWFYGIMVLEKNKTFSNKNYLHLIPFVIFVLLLFVIPSSGEFAVFWNYGLVVFHLVIYLTLSWINLFKNQEQASQNALYWYRNIVIGVTLVWFYYLSNFLKLPVHYITGPIFYTFLIYAFSYLFSNRHHFTLDKYESSNLDKNTSRDLFQKMKLLFTDELIFLESNLSLSAVAEKMAISPRMVSQIINENESRIFMNL